MQGSWTAMVSAFSYSSTKMASSVQKESPRLSMAVTDRGRLFSVLSRVLLLKECCLDCEKIGAQSRRRRR